jgi:hypothetical protein
MVREEDKKFYYDRVNLLETEGWRALVEELEELETAVSRIDSLESEKDLWFARGQLSILRQMLSLEEATKATMAELDI